MRLAHLRTELLLKPGADRSGLHDQDLHGPAIQRGQEPVQVFLPYSAKRGNAADDVWVPHGHALAERYRKPVVLLAKARLHLRDRMIPCTNVYPRRIGSLVPQGEQCVCTS